MTTKTLFGPLALASLVAACGGAPTNNGGADLVTAADGTGASDGGAGGDAATSLAGKKVWELTVDGQKRSFIVYLPEKARLTTTPAPVVFMIHGTSQEAEKFYTDSHWREKADEEGLIAVFPQALVYCYLDDENNDGVFTHPTERDVTTKWAHGALGDPARMPLCTPDQLATVSSATLRAQADHPLQDDVAFFRAMITFLKSSYNVDGKRIYSTGFSNGGQMSFRLALEMSDLLASGASAGGGFQPPLPPLAVPRPISMIYSVGERDDRYTPGCGVTTLPMNEMMLTTCASFGDGVDRIRALLQLGSAYTYDEHIVGGKKQVRWTFKTSTVGASNSLQVILMEDLFHQYADGNNYPIAAADYLYPFFMTFTSP